MTSLVKPAFILAVLGLLAGCASRPVRPRVITVETGPENAAGVLAGDIVPVVSAASASYVTIQVAAVPVSAKTGDKIPSGTRILGSGFMVDRRGNLITAGHVVLKPGVPVEVTLPDGHVGKARVVAVSHIPDIALVKLEHESTVPPVTPVADDCLAQGTEILSFGHPHGRGDVARIGTVASMSFTRPVHYGKFGYRDAMVLRLPIRKGESGGPVFTLDGRLAAMLVSVLADASGHLLNRAHALPASTIAHFICANLSCRPDWRRLARDNDAPCATLRKEPKTKVGADQDQVNRP